MEILYSDEAEYRFIVVSTSQDINDNGSNYLFLPCVARGDWTANPILVDRNSDGIHIVYKVSSIVISTNKNFKNLTEQKIFYRIMSDKMSTANAVLTAYYTGKNLDIDNEIASLRGINTCIRNNLLWLGLQQKTLQRKILSCAIIDINTAIPHVIDLPLPVTFDEADAIENIRVDINNTEVVTVFGKFKATIVDGDPANPNRRPDKIIHNAMVIYTNLQNDTQNDRNYGNPVVGYALGYDNFKELTINDDPAFKGFYACVDGLVAASIDKGQSSKILAF